MRSIFDIMAMISGKVDLSDPKDQCLGDSIFIPELQRRKAGDAELIECGGIEIPIELEMAVKYGDRD